jgi:hypothetical protein
VQLLSHRCLFKRGPTFGPGVAGSDSLQAESRGTSRCSRSADGHLTVAAKRLAKGNPCPTDYICDPSKPFTPNRGACPPTLRAQARPARIIVIEF